MAEGAGNAGHDRGPPHRGRCSLGVLSLQIFNPVKRPPGQGAGW